MGSDVLHDTVDLASLDLTLGLRSTPQRPRRDTASEHAARRTARRSATHLMSAAMRMAPGSWPVGRPSATTGPLGDTSTHNTVFRELFGSILKRTVACGCSRGVLASDATTV
jgi:hypothetical protein